MPRKMNVKYFANMESSQCFVISLFDVSQEAVNIEYLDAKTKLLPKRQEVLVLHRVPCISMYYVYIIMGKCRITFESNN